jgi:hypothetical protein
MKIAFARHLGRLLAVGSAACLVLSVSLASAAITLTGNPAQDGWTAGGNSLSSGVYVDGAGNYGFDVYSATMTADAAIATAMGWTQGDTILGVGGVFNGANPELVGATSGPKIQVKYGTGISVPTPWAASSTLVAPGNGNAHFGNGGEGAAEVRSSGFLSSSAWIASAGQLVPSTSSDPIDRIVGGTEIDNQPYTNVFGLIWTVSAGQPSAWEVLLDITQLAAASPTEPTPLAGDQAIMTIQNGAGDFTDALLNVSALAPAPAPEPASLVVWSLIGLTIAGAAWRHRNRSA